MLGYNHHFLVINDIFSIIEFFFTINNHSIRYLDFILNFYKLLFISFNLTFI